MDSVCNCSRILFYQYLSLLSTTNGLNSSGLWQCVVLKEKNHQWYFLKTGEPNPIFIVFQECNENPVLLKQF